MNKQTQAIADRIGFNSILDAVSVATGVDREDLLSVNKMNRKTTIARHLAIWAVRQKGIAYHTIAEMFGRNKHTGVMHGSKTIDNLLSVKDKEVVDLVESIKKSSNQ